LVQMVWLTKEDNIGQGWKVHKQILEGTLRLTQKRLAMSTSHHPLIDGQTENSI
jgi:hypothetical protein